MTFLIVLIVKDGPAYENHTRTIRDHALLYPTPLLKQYAYSRDYRWSVMELAMAYAAP